MVSIIRRSLLSVTPTTYTLFVFAADTNRRPVHRACSSRFSLRLSCAPHRYQWDAARVADTKSLTVVRAVVIHRSIRPTRNEERLPIRMEQNPVRTAAGFPFLDHTAGLQVDDMNIAL